MSVLVGFHQFYRSASHRFKFDLFGFSGASSETEKQLLLSRVFGILVSPDIG
jgi:hypothetical protein